MIFRSLKNFLNRFLGKRERFLVVEIENSRILISKISVDWRDKEIKILGKWTRELGWIEDTAKAFSFLQRVSKQIYRLATYKLIFVLEPRIATTVHASTKIIRNEGKKIIDEVDLDNLISQAIWQVFDRERGAAADKMFLDELDVLLADVKIKNVRIDGHRVINPIGFAAKTVEVFLSQTFAPRDFSESMRSIFPDNQFAFVSEAGSLGADILTRVCGGGFIFVNVDSARSDVYGAITEKDEVHRIWYLDSFSLGRKDFYVNLGKHFLLSAQSTEDVVWRCARGETSRFFAAKMEKFMREEWTVFYNGAASAVSSDRQFKHIKSLSALIRSDENFPGSLYSEPLRLKDGRKLEVSPVVLRDAVSSFGFRIVHKKHAPSFFPIVAILSLNRYSDEWLNKIANRRLRWLMPRNSQKAVA